MSPSQKNEEMFNQQLYNQLIEKVDFEDFFLKDIHISRFPTAIGELVNAEVKHTTELEHFSEEGLIASAYFEVTGTVTDDDGEKDPLFSMEFEYIVIYSIKEWDPEKLIPTHLEANHFAAMNVPLNIWPYAREIISEMTGRIGVPRLMIGMYRQLSDINEAVNERDDSN